ncbi:MAG: hypothetical protein J6X81_05120 [Muribaculaceae bacterium]|nr:hypothetical protein [Muribaculaceae bacterium]
MKHCGLSGWAGRLAELADLAFLADLAGLDFLVFLGRGSVLGVGKDVKSCGGCERKLEKRLEFSGFYGNFAVQKEMPKKAFS